MKYTIINITSLWLLSLIMVGCNTEPKPYTGLNSASQLEPSQVRSGNYRYMAPDVNYKKYTRFIIAPVQIYRGEDAQFGNTSEADKQTIADFMRKEFTKTISKSYSVVNEPGTNVADIRITLTGIETTTPGLSTVTHVLPIGLVRNLGTAATSGQGSFMGSVTYAIEIHDSQSGKLIAAVVAKQYANAMDLTATFAGLDSTKDGVIEGAERFKEAIDKIHGKE